MVDELIDEKRLILFDRDNGLEEGFDKNMGNIGMKMGKIGDERI